MRGAIPPLSNTPSWRGAHLKHRDNFILLQWLAHLNRTSDDKNLKIYTSFPVKAIHRRKEKLRNVYEGGRGFSLRRMLKEVINGRHVTINSKIIRLARAEY
jgi:hypothetical protein